MCKIKMKYKNPFSESKHKSIMVLTQVDLEKVVVHPLVLLSVVDHFNRMKKIGNQKRVVGLLLGSWSSKGILDIANSFAIPFDEDDKDKEVWFLDHEYLENMYNMFRFTNLNYISFSC